MFVSSKSRDSSNCTGYYRRIPVNNEFVLFKFNGIRGPCKITLSDNAEFFLG
jgi:hypothetical protein